MKKMSNKRLLDIFLEAGILKKIVRTGWDNKDIQNAESVADHSFRVAFLAMMLSSFTKLDQDKLVKMALIHDLGEAVIGDLIWEKGNEVIGSQEEKHDDESRAIKKLFKNNPEYIDLWEEYTTQKTKEAKLLKQIDKLEMAIQALEYEKEGYSPEDLQEFWDNAEKYLKGKELESIFRDLEKMRNRS